MTLHGHVFVINEMTISKFIHSKPSTFIFTNTNILYFISKKVQVGKDQEKAQSERDSHSKNRGGKKPN